MPAPYAVSSDLVSAWPAKSLAVANYVDSALAAKSDNAPAINAQTGTTYTFVLADATAGKTITASNAAASTYTVPPQSSVAFSAGALLRVTNLGAGVVTFAGGVGVTVTNTSGTLSQYQTATLVRTGSDAWTVIPFAASPSGLVKVDSASFTSVSSVTVNSKFTAAYRNYLITFDGVSASATNMRMRLRAGGSDITTNGYGAYLLRTRSDGGAQVYVSGTDTIPVTECSNFATNFACQLILFAPNVSGVKTRITGTSEIDESATLSYGANIFGHTQGTTQVDGFTLYNTGAINTTGTYQIYGIQS